MLNIIDPFIGEEYIDILRITASLIIILFFDIDLEINQKTIIPMTLGIIVGWFTYFGMVNGWMRVVGQKYEIPPSVTLIYVAILIIILPWMIYMSETFDKENTNKS